jgi:anhydro-N-acetylmuramic acid kinase
MSGSSLDGLDIAFVEFQENAGKWNYEIGQADCYPYSEKWLEKLRSATTLKAMITNYYM